VEWGARVPRWVVAVNWIFVWLSILLSLLGTAVLL